MAKRKEVKKIIIKKPIDNLKDDLKPPCFGNKEDYCLKDLCEWFDRCIGQDPS